MTTTQRIFLHFFQMALWGKSVEDFSWGDWEKIDWEGVAVTDGPVPASLKQVIDNLQFSRLAVARRSGKAERTIYNEKLPVEVIFLPREKNKGLGETLRVAVEHTQCDYVARMDADDICMPQRFEKQLKVFEEPKMFSM